jgi:hypothetical protein
LPLIDETEGGQSQQGRGERWIVAAVVEEKKELTSPLSNLSELVGRQNYIPNSTNPLSS